MKVAERDTMILFIIIRIILRESRKIYNILYLLE